MDHGRRYCYRIKAVTAEGISDQMETEDVQAGTKGNSPTVNLNYFSSLWLTCQFQIFMTLQLQYLHDDHVNIRLLCRVYKQVSEKEVGGKG